jgi:hypothetical protein
MTLQELVDEDYVLQQYHQTEYVSDEESLTEILWWNEEGSGNFYDLDQESYHQIVEPFVKKIMTKHNLKPKFH